MLHNNIATARTEWLLTNWILTLLNRYHVPRSFLQPGSNDLVLFEQFGGDPSKISFAIRQTGSVCAQVSEAHPAQIESWISSQQNTQRNGPALRLECPKEGQVISSIKFASFGTPSGTCGTYSHGECSSTQALSVVQEVTAPFSCLKCANWFLWVSDSVTGTLQACIGVSSCSVPVSSNYFGNPCPRVTKSLAVEAACSWHVWLILVHRRQKSVGRRWNLLW